MISAAAKPWAVISNGIHAISRRAQVPIHSLHQFRHSCASDLLESGVHLAQVQRILGHCSITQPQYLCAHRRSAARAAMTLHPINDWLRQRVTHE
jgi:site-specific recombinase XerD